MIRLGKVSDLEQIMTITNIIKEEMKKENNPQWNDLYPTKEDYLLDIEEEILYVYEETKILGFITIKKDIEDEYQMIPNRTNESSYNIHRLGINPSYRNIGLASILINYAEDLARKDNIKRIKVDTEKRNIKMNNLLKKLNYKYIGEFKYENNEGIFNYYEKKL